MRLEQFIIDEETTAKTAENFEWMIAQLLYFCSHSKKSVEKVFDEASQNLSRTENDPKSFYEGTYTPKYKESTIKAVKHLLKWKNSFNQICNLGNTVRCMGSGRISSPGGSPKADLILDGVGVSVKLSGDIVAASAQGKSNFQQIFQDGLKWFENVEGRQPKGKSGKNVVNEYKDAISFIKEEVIGEVKHRLLNLSDKRTYDKMFASALKKSKNSKEIKELIDEIVKVQSDEIQKLNGKLDEHSKFMASEIRKRSVDTLNGIFDGPDGDKFKMYIVAEQLTGWNKYKGNIGCARYILSPDGLHEMINEKGKPNEKLLLEIASRTTFNFRGLPKNRGGKLRQLESILAMSTKRRIEAMKTFFDMAHGMKADVKSVKESIDEGIIDTIAQKIKSFIMIIYNKMKNFISDFLKVIELYKEQEQEFLNGNINTVYDIIEMT